MRVRHGKPCLVCLEAPSTSFVSRRCPSSHSQSGSGRLPKGKPRDRTEATQATGHLDHNGTSDLVERVPGRRSLELVPMPWERPERSEESTALCSASSRLTMEYLCRLAIRIGLTSRRPQLGGCRRRANNQYDLDDARCAVPRGAQGPNDLHEIQG